jgi:hypothetical protein
MITQTSLQNFQKSSSSPIYAPVEEVKRLAVIPISFIVMLKIESPHLCDTSDLHFGCNPYILLPSCDTSQKLHQKYSEILHPYILWYQETTEKKLIGTFILLNCKFQDCKVPSSRRAPWGERRLEPNLFYEPLKSLIEINGRISAVEQSQMERSSWDSWWLQ